MPPAVAETKTADATETKTGRTETPSRAPPETRKATNSSDNDTKNLVTGYLHLCHNPMRDLRGWIAETYDHRNAPSLRRQPLPQMRSRMDAHRQGRQDHHHLLVRSGSGLGRDGGLRPLRATGKQPDTYAGELAALRVAFGWREAAIRAFAPPHLAPALLAALKDEQRAAERALWAKHRRQREEDTDNGRKARQRRPQRPPRRPKGSESGPRR